jgi:tetratricopeptide (TPR) repeat protein
MVPAIRHLKSICTMKKNAGSGPRFFCLAPLLLLAGRLAAQAPEVQAIPLRPARPPEPSSDFTSEEGWGIGVPDIPTSTTLRPTNAATAAIRSRLASQVIRDALLPFQAGDYRAALDELNRVLAVRTNDVANLFFRATVLDRQGDAEGAAADYVRVIRLEPKWADVEIALGDLYSRQGRNDDALKHFRRAAEIDPQDRLAIFRSYLCLLLAGQLKEADEIRVSAKVSRGSPDYYFIHAAHSFHQGKPEAARYLYRAGVLSYPAEVAALYQAPLIAQGWVDQ